MEPYIHSSAFIEEGSSIGHGSKIWHHVQIRSGAKIGNKCVIGKGVFIDANVVIGNNVKIQNYVSVYQGVTVEDNVFIGPHVVFTNDLRPRAEENWEITKTTVEKGVSIGANSTVICGIKIGQYAMVGAGSVVTKSIQKHCLVFGNPAKFSSYICFCGNKLDSDSTKNLFTCKKCKKKVDLSI